MSEPMERNSRLRLMAFVTVGVTLLLVALSLGDLVASTVIASGGADWLRVGVAIVALAAVAAWTLLGLDLVKLLMAGETSTASISGRMGRLETLFEDVAGSNRKMLDLLQLSDQARSLIYRDRELDAFRETIHDDIIRQDYRSAEFLIESIEKRFGYVEEAARLRGEVAASRKATLDEKIDTAVGRIQEIIDAKDWARALRESQRVLRLFPTHAKVRSLPERIEAARNKSKRELLQAYGEAVRKNDVDRSIELLKELDRYLTPQEGAALEESARGVFKARLHNLGVQFAIRVTEKQWADAISVGEDIIREFPNTRMSQEVRLKMDLLRSRAAAAATEGAPAGV